jgi:hypothetical protein
VFWARGFLVTAPIAELQDSLVTYPESPLLPDNVLRNIVAFKFSCIEIKAFIIVVAVVFESEYLL